MGLDAKLERTAARRPLRESKDWLDSWAADNLDSQMIQRDIRSATDLIIQAKRDRPAWVAENADQGGMNFSCPGAKFYIHAPHVTQTSTAMQEWFANYRKTVPLGTPLPVHSNVHPMVMDRVCYWYDTLSLYVGNPRIEKIVFRGAWDVQAPPPGDPPTHLQLLLHIHKFSKDLKDEVLMEVTAARLRSYLLSRFMDDEELATGVKTVYNIGLPPVDHHPLMRKLILSTIAVNALDVQTSEDRNKFTELAEQCRQFHRDFSHAQLYYTGVHPSSSEEAGYYVDGQAAEEEGDEEDEVAGAIEME